MKKILMLGCISMFAVSVFALNESTICAVYAASTSQKDENLTIENCKDFSEILSKKDSMDPSYSTFATKYKGEIIEFDGSVDYLVNAGNYKTRYDFLLSAGDYSPDTQMGPTFKFENVNFFDLNADDDVYMEDNLHIEAKVDRYDSDSGLFYLEPVKLTHNKTY